MSKKVKRGPTGPRSRLAGKKGSKSGGFGGNRSHESAMQNKGHKSSIYKRSGRRG